MGSNRVRPIHPKHFLTQEEKDRLVSAIQTAERQSSGEICVAVEKSGREDVLARAQKVFKKLGMTKTKRRNGVLFFLSLKERRFAVLGDTAIHQKLGENFWQSIAAEMEIYFKRDEFGAGLEAGIRKAAAELALHFPRSADDRNELPDKIQEEP